MSAETLVLRTRPTVVEAKRLTEESAEEIARWCGGWKFAVGYVRWFSRDANTVLQAEAGDWVVRNAFGDFVRVSDSAIFSEYEAVVPLVSE